MLTLATDRVHVVDDDNLLAARLMVGCDTVEIGDRVACFRGMRGFPRAVIRANGRASITFGGLTFEGRFDASKQRVVLDGGDGTAAFYLNGKTEPRQIET